MKGGRQGNPSIAEFGKNTQFKSDEERTKNSARKAAKKRVANLNIQKLASKIASASPKMSDQMTAQLINQLGFDVDDSELFTNGAILIVKLLHAGMNGNLSAIQQFFELTGQKPDSRSQNDLARIEIERERLKLERDRLEFEKQRLGQASAQGDSAEAVKIIRSDAGDIDVEGADG